MSRLAIVRAGRTNFSLCSTERFLPRDLCQVSWAHASLASGALASSADWRRLGKETRTGPGVFDPPGLSPQLFCCESVSLSEG